LLWKVFFQGNAPSVGADVFDYTFFDPFGTPELLT